MLSINMIYSFFHSDFPQSISYSFFIKAIYFIYSAQVWSNTLKLLKLNHAHYFPTYSYSDIKKKKKKFLKIQL